MVAPAARSTILRVLAAGFCLYHMAAMVLANMPMTTAFGEELRVPFDPYIVYAGLWQNWAMFETIPYFRSIRPVLVARYPNGQDLERGALLPGLVPYRPRTRLVGLFLRYTFPPSDIEPYARAYLRRACGAFEEATGARPSSVNLALDGERLVPLADVRRSGAIGRPSRELSAVAGPCD